jgi:CheY-like chemotaxis protein
VQVQVNEKAGLTFSSALRSILRQDPDVVLVGEIRDKETAQIAVQASLTGHLVFSTLHTNDAASSVTRLLDIGIESYKIASALKGIVAQRLLRRLCSACKVIDTDPVPERLQRWVPAGSTLYKGVGCAECSQTGYRGRMAIVEVLITTPDVERRISANDTVERIAEAARMGGMRGLWDSGLMHVRAGETSIDELQRVVEAPSEAVAAARSRPTPGEGQAAIRSSGPVAAPRGSASITYRNTPVSTPTSPHPAYHHEDAAFQLLDEISPHPRRNGHTVLLVEDEDSLRRVLKDLLEREGLTVVEARDGVEALDQVDRVGPDLMVLDLNLPRLDGYAVLTHLRARPSTANLPVLVLTAKGDEDNEVRVFEFGANDFLQKPFRPRALAARLRAMLRA